MPYGMIAVDGGAAGGAAGLAQASGGGQPAQAPPAPPPPIPLLPGQAGAAAGAGQGQVFTTQPPFDRNEIPKELIPLVGMTLGILMTIIILFPIARAIGRMIDRRTDRSLVKVADIAPQIRQLQESVDTMAIELERISEAQRFTAKLMAERPQGSIASGER